jgi:hypothetical protein
VGGRGLEYETKLGSTQGQRASAPARSDEQISGIGVDARREIDGDDGGRGCVDRVDRAGDEPTCALLTPVPSSAVDHDRVSIEIDGIPGPCPSSRISTIETPSCRAWARFTAASPRRLAPIGHQDDARGHPETPQVPRSDEAVTAVVPFAAINHDAVSREVWNLFDERQGGAPPGRFHEIEAGNPMLGDGASVHTPHRGPVSISIAAGQ